jgi:hypothetical protein
MFRFNQALWQLSAQVTPLPAVAALLRSVGRHGKLH